MPEQTNKPERDIVSTEIINRGNGYFTVLVHHRKPGNPSVLHQWTDSLSLHISQASTVAWALRTAGAQVLPPENIIMRSLPMASILFNLTGIGFLLYARSHNSIVACLCFCGFVALAVGMIVIGAISDYRRYNA